MACEVKGVTTFEVTIVSSLENIQQPIASEMKAFEDYFKTAMRSDKMLLDKITHYIIKRKRKRMSARV